MYGAKKGKKPLSKKMNSKMTNLRKKMATKYGKKGASKS